MPSGWSGWDVFAILFVVLVIHLWAKARWREWLRTLGLPENKAEGWRASSAPPDAPSFSFFSGGPYRSAEGAPDQELPRTPKGATGPAPAPACPCAAKGRCESKDRGLLHVCPACGQAPYWCFRHERMHSAEAGKEITCPTSLHEKLVQMPMRGRACESTHWWRWFLTTRGRQKGLHLHQRCNREHGGCGHEWVRMPLAGEV